MSTLLELIQKTLQDKLGENIVTIDMREVSTFTDYYVIATANSFRHAQALADAVTEAAGKNGYPIRSQEGEEGSSWILLDANDVIVHIFTAEGRRMYQLEALWADQPQQHLSDSKPVI